MQHLCWARPGRWVLASPLPMTSPQPADHGSPPAAHEVAAASGIVAADAIHGVPAVDWIAERSGVQPRFDREPPPSSRAWDVWGASQGAHRRAELVMRCRGCEIGCLDMSAMRSWRAGETIAAVVWLCSGHAARHPTAPAQRIHSVARRVVEVDDEGGAQPPQRVSPTKG